MAKGLISKASRLYAKRMKREICGLWQQGVGVYTHDGLRIYSVKMQGGVLHLQFEMEGKFRAVVMPELDQITDGYGRHVIATTVA